MVSVPARRRQVAYGRERGLSARRACTLFSVARSALRVSQPARRSKDAAVIARMKELSAQYPRYGYRRIRIFLGRDGHRMSPGRALSAVAGGESAGAAQAADESVLRSCGRDRKRRSGRTRYGPTTSCSTIAPTASSSSA